VEREIEQSAALRISKCRNIEALQYKKRLKDNSSNSSSLRTLVT